MRVRWSGLSTRRFERVGDNAHHLDGATSTGIMQLLAILLVRSRIDWCAGVGSPLAGDHRSQATFLHDPVEGGYRGFSLTEGLTFIVPLRLTRCLVFG